MINKRKTVLVVEDEKINRQILKRILQDKYDVLEAVNGQEGWEILSSEKM